MVLGLEGFLGISTRQPVFGAYHKVCVSSQQSPWKHILYMYVCAGVSL